VALVSVKGNLECFKKGTEPAARSAGSEYEDELDRAVARMRGREPAELDGERELAPSDDELDREEPTWAPSENDGELVPAGREGMQDIDTRPPPRAGPRVTPGAKDTEDRFRPNDNEYRDGRSAGAPPDRGARGGYRANPPAVAPPRNEDRRKSPDARGD
jgi:hypothetical protein